MMHQRVEEEHGSTGHYSLSMHDEVVSKAYQALDVARDLL